VLLETHFDEGKSLTQDEEAKALIDSMYQVCTDHEWASDASMS
jgi:hypothetical protein